MGTQTEGMGATDTGTSGMGAAGGVGYRTTGWDPLLLMLLSGGLAAGSGTLKVLARRR
ncbi:MAG TPA: hypothetical protein VGN26_00480 [Armatimonadota bacterium]|jgi:hypothetical protein